MNNIENIPQIIIKRLRHTQFTTKKRTHVLTYNNASCNWNDITDF